MSWSVNRCVNLAMTMALVLFFGLGWEWFSNKRAVEESDRWESQAYIVTVQLQRLLSSLVDAETGQRGFIITGREEYLSPYNEALGKVDQEFASLRALTTELPGQKKRLAAMEPLIQAKLAELKRVIELYRSSGRDAASAAVMTHLGKSYMDQIRQGVAEAQAEEDQLLRERMRIKDADLRRSFQLGAFEGVLSGALLFMSIFLVRRHAKLVRSAESRYRWLFESAFDGLLLLDPLTHKITEANPSVACFLAYSHEELVGKELWQLGIFRDEETYRTVLRELEQNGFSRREDLQFKAKTGEIRWGELVINVYKREGICFIQCNVRDVTQRRKVEEALRTQAELIEIAHDGIIVRDLDGKIHFWNHGAEEMYGYSKEQADGRISHELLRTIFPQPLPEIEAANLRDGCWEGELIHTVQNGTRIVVASRWVLQAGENGRPQIGRASCRERV